MSRSAVDVKGEDIYFPNSFLSEQSFCLGKVIVEFPFTMMVKACVTNLEVLMQFHVNLIRKIS